jgi:hypothetical protein
VLFFCATTWAQVPVPPLVPQRSPSGSSGLTFEARLVSSGGATKTEKGELANANMQKFESTQTHESKSRVELAVRNLSAVQAQARFDWFFVAREIPSRREFVWDQGQRDMTVAAGGQQTETLESKPLMQTTSRKTEYTKQQNTLGPQQMQQQSSTEQSGGRPSGWIVRMWDGDHLLQVQASSSDLEAVGRDPVRLGKLTGAPAGAPR